MSVPSFPFISLLPELPLRILSRLFPVASISKEPVNVIFSILFGRL